MLADHAAAGRTGTRDDAPTAMRIEPTGPHSRPLSESHRPRGGTWIARGASGRRQARDENTFDKERTKSPALDFKRPPGAGGNGPRDSTARAFTEQVADLVALDAKEISAVDPVAPPTVEWIARQQHPWPMDRAAARATDRLPTLGVWGGSGRHIRGRAK